MKRILSVLALLAVALPAFGVELHLASNEQLLQELRRRMNGGGGGGSGAIATYTCDSSTYLHVDLVSALGSQQKNYYVGDAKNCSDQAALLAANKSKVYNLELIAVCDSSAYLYKIPLLPSGTFGDVKNTYIGNQSTCLAQAKQINQGL